MRLIVKLRQYRDAPNQKKHTSVHMQCTETTPPLSRDSAWSVVYQAA